MRWNVTPNTPGDRRALLLILGGLLAYYGFYAARTRWGVEEVGHWFEKPDYRAYYEVVAVRGPRSTRQPRSVVVRGLVERGLEEVPDAPDPEGSERSHWELCTRLWEMRLPSGSVVNFEAESCAINFYEDSECEDLLGNRWLIRLGRQKLEAEDLGPR